MHPGIAQVALKGIVAGITIATKELQSLITDPITDVGGKPFGHGTPGTLVEVPAIQLVSRLTHQQASCSQLGRHICQAKLHALEFADRVTKLLALLHIGQRIVQCLLGSAHRAGGNIDSPTIEGLHGELEPFPLFAQPIAGRNANPVENNLPGRLAVPAHLLFCLAIAHAGGIGRHHKG